MSNNDLNENSGDSIHEIIENLSFQISKQIDEIRSLKDRIQKLEQIFDTEPKVISKKISVREFFLSKKPKNDIQKTLLICYFLEKQEGLSLINIKDIEQGFRNAKEKTPDNINYKVYMNIRKGFMMETNEKKDNLKSWVLTNSGEKFVENEFNEA